MRFEVAVHVKRFVKHSRRRRKVWRPRVHSYFEATQHPRKGKGNGRINLQKKKTAELCALLLRIYIATICRGLLFASVAENIARVRFVSTKASSRPSNEHNK